MEEVEMRDEEKKSEIEMIRTKLKEWKEYPYQFRMFNMDESRGNWRNPFRNDKQITALFLSMFNSSCEEYKSFDFSIEPMVVGKVKHCSYSELDGMTNFKDRPSLIIKTVSGRLLDATIVEGSEKRPAIVKTWDFILPMRFDGAETLNKFCDELELFTDERVNTHPNLVKLYRYCHDTRLAVVFDEKFTERVLSDVLLSDAFGWDERMKVATQLADLFSCLHEKKIALGCVTAYGIMVDEEVNIKVFDFGYITSSLMVDPDMLGQPRAPEAFTDERTMEADIFIFGFLLLELIAKKKFRFGSNSPRHMVESVRHESDQRGKKYLVHDCFREVDDSTANEITQLALRCVDLKPDERPAMKDVLEALKAMKLRGEKRKRDAIEAEQNKR